MPDNFKGQKYSSLKSAAQKAGELFQDPEFPPTNKSLFYSRQDKDIEWKRPNELCKVPKLVVEGVTCDDLNEGELGNTWFVSACSSLAQEPKIWQKVVPGVKEQEWGPDDSKYAGIFHFQFWRYGRWLDVVIDDLLPTKNGKLIFCHSKSTREYWSALLEKAYAKLYGDYESLSTGYAADALVDFTGGVAEKLLVQELGLQDEEKMMKFFHGIRTAVENKSLVTVAVSCSNNEVGESAGQGLIKGHSYGITDVKAIKLNKGMSQALGGAELLHLVRLKNPWGTREWTGAWSDNSTEWQALSIKDRDKLGIKFQREGEFWMSFKDFLDKFTNVDICHFVNTKMFSLKKSWSESILHGEWVVGAKGTHRDRAGGNEKSPTFLYNPQFIFDVVNEVDTIMISLEQDDVVVGKQSGEGNNVIGFHIMKVEANRKYRVHIPGEKVTATDYRKSRNIFLKLELTTGRYVIIPSTDKAGVGGKFMLRVYTTASAHAMGVAQKVHSQLGYVKPLLKDCPASNMCSKAPAFVTRLTVVKAAGLEKKEGKENVIATDPYPVVRCEGETVKGPWEARCVDPNWNFKTIFYRRKPSEKPMAIEIWNKNRMTDELMGIATVKFMGKEEGETQQLNLFGKGKEAEIQKQGKLTIEITTTDDLTAL